MDIGLLSIAMSQGKVQQQASISVIKHAMGNAEQQGEAIQKLIESTDLQHQANHI
ncbi:hypothetical protein GGQ92_001076 [Gracilibacillus halotolerans]|uniref:Motility protein n=1 Tax=Gracilibacillus halotolerans TaxID=74386 RepID=A0A841RMC2_9BACI|nr:hypothetical protein [Gracilibacillus halotolerans]